MLRYALALALAASASACRTETPPLDQPDEASDPFTVVLSQFAAEPDQPPRLDGDTLVVRVVYEGDCTDHVFGLAQAQRSDTLVFTLRHDAQGDDCTGEVYDELRLGLPEPAPAAGVVVLRNPRGGAPFVLRD